MERTDARLCLRVGVEAVWRPLYLHARDCVLIPCAERVQSGCVGEVPALPFWVVRERLLWLLPGDDDLEVVLILDRLDLSSRYHPLARIVQRYKYLGTSPTECRLASTWCKLTFARVRSAFGH